GCGERPREQKSQQQRRDNAEQRESRHGRGQQSPLSLEGIAGGRCLLLRLRGKGVHLRFELVRDRVFLGEVQLHRLVVASGPVEGEYARAGGGEPVVRLFDPSKQPALLGWTDRLHRIQQRKKLRLGVRDHLVVRLVVRQQGHGPVVALGRNQVLH